MYIKRAGVFLALAFGAPAASPALAAESVYTKLDLDQNCRWDPHEGLSEEEKEELQGNSALCDGFPGYPVHFAEYDLRQFTAFGPVNDDYKTPGGFGQFNHVGGTVEWRTERGRPYATILRWFIENADPATGAPSEASTGQVLVVSTVAQPESAIGDRRSCPIGYVDARVNADANEMARQIADTIARQFRCGADLPSYYGERSPLAGDPRELAPPH